MGKIWMPGGGGGADVDVVTAEAGDVLEGKVIVGPDGEPLTGTLTLSGNAADSQVLSGQTYYNTDAKTKRTGSMSNQGAWTSRLDANGKITIPAGYHNGAGYVDQALSAKGAATYTPGRSNQTIGAGQYLTGAQTILGDANLLAANIKKGVSIFGIIGSWEGYVTSPLYLFNRGTWTGVSSTGVTKTNGYDIKDWGKHIQVSTMNTQRETMGRLNSAVNLTSYNYLKILVKGGSSSAVYGDTIFLGISTASNITAPASLVSKATIRSVDAETTVILNVSNYSGNYFIYFGNTQATTGYSGGYDLYQVFLTSS